MRSWESIHPLGGGRLVKGHDRASPTCLGYYPIGQRITREWEIDFGSLPITFIDWGPSGGCSVSWLNRRNQSIPFPPHITKTDTNKKL